MIEIGKWLKQFERHNLIDKTTYYQQFRKIKNEQLTI